MTDIEKVLVIGANGKIGRLLVERLHERAIAVRAMLRPGGANPFKEAVEVIRADLEGGIETALAGVSHVVFTAGSGAATGFDKTLLVDLWGAVKAVDAAKNAQAQQFVMVSSRGASDPDKGPERIKPYLIAKHFADEHLRRVGLTYTILQPGRLLDEPGCNLVMTARPTEAQAQCIAREDVADVVVHCLGNAAFFNRTLELFKPDSAASGTPISAL